LLRISSVNHELLKSIQRIQDNFPYDGNGIKAIDLSSMQFRQETSSLKTYCFYSPNTSKNDHVFAWLLILVFYELSGKKDLTVINKLLVNNEFKLDWYLFYVLKRFRCKIMHFLEMYSLKRIQIRICSWVDVRKPLLFNVWS
jgi:hypothetical protein